MPIDIFQSRRGFYEPCRWWSRNEEDGENDELIMKRIPKGSFYAKEVTGENEKESIVAGAFSFERNDVTIQTPDNVLGMKSNDIVEYQGEKWRVLNVSKVKARIQNSEYARDRNASHIWNISLRR